MSSDKSYLRSADMKEVGKITNQNGQGQTKKQIAIAQLRLALEVLRIISAVLRLLSD